MALKVPRSQTPLHRELLRREIAMLLRLSRHQHPGIVRVLEADLEGPVPFYAMELIDGPDLGAVIAQRSAATGSPSSATVSRTVVIDAAAGRGAGTPTREWAGAPTGEWAGAPTAEWPARRRASGLVRRRPSGTLRARPIVCPPAAATRWRWPSS